MLQSLISIVDQSVSSYFFTICSLTRDFCISSFDSSYLFSVKSLSFGGSGGGKDYPSKSSWACWGSRCWCSILCQSRTSVNWSCHDVKLSRVNFSCDSSGVLLFDYGVDVSPELLSIISFVPPYVLSLMLEHLQPTFYSLKFFYSILEDQVRYSKYGVSKQK